MASFLHELTTDDLTQLNETHKQAALNALEHEQIIFLPNYFFKHDAQASILFNENLLDKRHKNLSFNHKNQQLKGQAAPEIHVQTALKTFLDAFACFSHDLISRLLPLYAPYLQWGRTSYRPIEIEQRLTSKRQDDTRLHVDAFPTTPVQGRRILRVFCNINPYAAPRIWHTGESFTAVLDHFAHKLSSYQPALAHLLKWTMMTKGLRTAYDHYQLKLHDAMKESDAYQQHAPKQLIHFPAHSTWIVFTDQVSHAALKGQYVLEQTFYLPTCYMQEPKCSPYAHWQARNVI